MHVPEGEHVWLASQGAYGSKESWERRNRGGYYPYWCWRGPDCSHSECVGCALSVIIISTGNIVMSNIVSGNRNIRMGEGTLRCQAIAESARGIRYLVVVDKVAPVDKVRMRRAIAMTGRS